MGMLRRAPTPPQSSPTCRKLWPVSSRKRQSAPRGRNRSEASYDEASRARYRVRASRPGGSGSGGSDRGLEMTRRLFVGLLAGVNVGGLGTPVASLASLISLKFYLRREDAQTGRYLLWFTLANVAGLVILLTLSAFLVG